MLKSINTFGFTLAAFARPYFGRAHLQAYQLRKLKNLLAHASTHIPYYRDLFNSNGIEVSDIRNLADFRKIPLTGKQQLRELFRSIPSGEIDRKQLIEHKTSGSTGIPLHILRSPAEERRLNMLNWRMHWMLGLRPGDRMAKVKTTWEPLSARFNHLENLARAARLVNRRVFDCFLDPAENYRKIVDFQPHILTGYPGALVKIALQHAQQGGKLKYLRRVSCGGESLAPHQRRILEACFEVPVHDTYGTSECNLAAWLCPETGHYHVCDDGILLEVCRDGVPVAEGQSGEIVITSLHSLTMPVIRHTMGDRAVAGPGPCRCGSPFSTIEKLQGRIIDYLPLADGRELHPFELLNEIVTGSGDWILEYQLIQEDLDKFRLLIVPLRPVDTDEEARFRGALLDKLGAGTQLQIEWTGSIAREGSGKLHFCRSRVE
jgi:phenylacetate-CoA ligase